eukprot:scaffold184144_cov18-Tisochrysis_lutea.AAC.1
MKGGQGKRHTSCMPCTRDMRALADACHIFEGGGNDKGATPRCRKHATQRLLIWQSQNEHRAAGQRASHTHADARPRPSPPLHCNAGLSHLAILLSPPASPAGPMHAHRRAA